MLKLKNINRNIFSAIIIIYIALVTSLTITQNKALAFPNLVVDVSSKEIFIDSSFAGTDILLFGAKNVSDSNIVVLIQGPKNNYKITKKYKYGPIWINKKEAVFKNVYSMYSVYSEAEIEKTEKKLFNQNLWNNVKIQKVDYRANPEELKLEMIRYQKNNGLYKDYIYNINYIGDNLFKTNIYFPQSISTGNYSVEVYLIKDQKILSFDVISIKVKKKGIESFIYFMAKQQGFIYGLICLMIAFASGWISNMIFWKN